MKEQKTADFIKERYPFYDEDLATRDVELNGEQVQELMQSYSDQQNAELLAWKESAMRELNALDLQSLGAKLGVGLGQSVSENIHAKVDGLLERAKELGNTIESIEMEKAVLRDKIEILQERLGDTQDHYPLAARIHNAIAKELEDRKAAGDVFLTNEEIDDLINKALKK